MAATIKIQPMFAEVSDKIPTIGGLWLIGLIAAGLVLGMFRLSRYTLLLSVPPAVLWPIGITLEFYGDECFKTAVIAEMGGRYLDQVVSTAALPLIVGLACLALYLRSWRSIAAKQFHG